MKVEDADIIRSFKPVLHQSPLYWGFMQNNLQKPLSGLTSATLSCYTLNYQMGVTSTRIGYQADHHTLQNFMREEPSGSFSLLNYY